MKINIRKLIKKRLRLELILAFVISFILGAILFTKIFELAVFSEAGSDRFTGLRCAILGISGFIITFLLLTRKKMKYIEEISNGLLEISKGNLNYRVAKKGSDELAGLANYINYMASELNKKNEKERKTEKTKNELITNVSHDLRTPLTSIMGYIGLVKDKKYVDDAQMDEYMTIAYNKSEKLKILIDDLFEYTKLTNETITLNKEEVALNELLNQLTEELVPIFEENNLIVEREISKEKLIVNVDINKILRVFENLIMNAIKYSNKPSIVKVRLYKDKSDVIVSIENQGPQIPKEDLEKLFERLYRQDKSRTSSTGGSGLGLAIAKNIVLLHGGKIWAECEDENIRFFVKLKIS